jgi:hypothetical protein
VEIQKKRYNKATEENVRDAIWSSGYLLERRVSAFLRNSGYKVMTNRGFYDPEANKAGEYDVYAHKEISIYGSGSYGIYPTLICECKNNYQPIAFFIHDDEEFQPLVDEVRVSGIPAKIWVRNKYVSIQEFTNVINLHHYCQPRAPVATQCCTVEKKKTEQKVEYWEASHDQQLHETENRIVKAMEHEIEVDYKNMTQWLSPEESEKEFIDLSLYYPLVIYQGELKAIRINKNNLQTKDDLIIEECQHIQYNPEFYSFYENEVISYHVDIITEKYLPTYIQMIEKEISEIKNIISSKKRDVKNSVNKLIVECKSLETKPKSYRKYLEYTF